MKKLLIALLILTFSVYGVTYQTINASTTVCNRAPLLNITNIVVPSPVYTDSIPTFTVTVKNIGNCYTMDNVFVYIDAYNSLNIDVWNDSQVSNSGFGPGTSSSFSFSNSFTEDTYSLNVSVSYSVFDFNSTNILNSSNNKTINMSVTTRPVTVTQGPGGGGGGGGVPSSISIPAFVQFKKYPVVQEVAPGSVIIVDMSIKNPQDKTQNIDITFKGVAAGWINLFQNNIKIDPLQTRAVSFTLAVPENADSGDYLAKAEIHDGGISGYSYFVVRVKKYPDNYPAPRVYRKVDLNFIDNKSTVTITVQNDADPHKRIEIYEDVPKILADNVDKIDFTTAPSSIVRADPVFMFALADVAPNERRGIEYTINNVIDEYEPYVYWPIEQINVLYERGADKIQIYNIYQTIAQRGTGQTSLSFDIANVYTNTLNITIQPWLPSGWSSSPDNMSLLMPAQTQTNVKFAINIPVDIPDGAYYGGVNIYYENTSIAKEIVFRLAPGGLLFGFGFFGIDFGLVLIIIAVIIGIAIIRRIRRANEGYEYKQDVDSTLSEVKSLILRR